MPHPPFLRAGDTIGILSTARKTELAVIEKASRLIEQYGFKVKLAPILFSEDRQFAGTDRQRIADMHSLLQDAEVKAILCARGGYGTTRIIDQINWRLLKEQPKWICGFSDVTAILCHLQKLEIESLHCTMAALFDSESKERIASVESMFNLLQGQPFELAAPSHPFNRPGQASGQLIGGNLSLLSRLLAPPLTPITVEKFSFWKIWMNTFTTSTACVVQLKRSGKLR